jgi:hypothetical protein
MDVFLLDREKLFTTYVADDGLPVLAAARNGCHWLCDAMTVSNDIKDVDATDLPRRDDYSNPRNYSTSTFQILDS